MNFCMYFDSNYLLKGLACYDSLNGFLKEKLKLYVVCLDEKVYEVMSKFENVITITLKEIEDYYPKLLTIKNTRIPKEYFATTSAIVPMYVFDKYNCETLYYSDADIAFWTDPLELEDIFKDYSIMVSDHGYEPPRAGIRFNVGILGYRNDINCREFLEWWAERCIEWCYWTTTPDGKCGDQGYLNILHDDPNKFKRALSCPNPGVNMGPWNIGMHKITLNNNKPFVDGIHNLVCYHYHEFELVGNGYHPTNWKITKTDKEIVYEPYFKLLLKNRGLI